MAKYILIELSEPNELGYDDEDYEIDLSQIVRDLVSTLTQGEIPCPAALYQFETKSELIGHVFMDI